MDKPLFIVGLPRSGSTLWFNLITMNREIFGIGEMFFLNPWWRKDFRYFLHRSIGDLSKLENIKKMTGLMFSGIPLPGLTASFWRYEAKQYDKPSLKERVTDRILESDQSLQSIFKAITEEISSYSGFDRYCAKFPVFVNYVPYLLEWYPNCKVIHIVRDPRAMAISRANFRGEKRLNNRTAMISFAVTQFIWTSRLHTKYDGMKNYALFRYEDLLANPEETIKKLCKFAEIDFDPQMLEPGEGQASSVTGKKRGGFDTKALSHWRDVISPMEEKVVTTLTRNSMKRFGYTLD
ncbi:MAG TPA: sulfotransferase [Anaerolineales bacterium]|nr:sulfotransferase [Anaerolineales bacterium]